MLLRITMSLGLLFVSGLCPAAENEPADPVAARAAMIRQIDARIAEKLQLAGMEPAPRSDDAEFLRRVYLDLTGVVPRVAEVRAFLADVRPDKRTRLIDSLLESPAHATHLANTWRNTLLPGDLNLEQINNVVGVQNWLRQRFVENLRYDNLVSDLLVATDGNELGPALYYTSLDLDPEKLAASTARIFLGLQIECAQCHDHPFDSTWKQNDFWGYAAFFARLTQPEGGQPLQMVRRIMDRDEGEVKLPDTETVVLPKFPGGISPGEDELGTRREQLAIWMASRDNPYLPRAGVNRAWHHLFGRGLVEPVDDIGPHNAASHGELFEELTQYFVQSGFDLRELYRTLANTGAYQRSSRWTSDKEPPPELFASMAVKTLTAEQLYDSLNRVLNRQPQAMFPGANVASSLLDPRRIAFIAKMEAGGRSPLEYQAGILQALTSMNGGETSEATDPARSPLLGALEAPFLADSDRVETLFLATLSRLPADDERSLFVGHLEKSSPGEQQKAWSNILWALVNSAEFTLNH
ncbi:MAG TPA: DUF1549 and DUF1553 domain-containing protein [Pirellulaceae bacterium]|nr:DUF1549 and DUF1553 domain-containing protein [Pirellulaceae bacterium]